ncbi:uncharacterized protein TNCV_2754261 [Trichonephila clavipes]|nr:uncharacterized protein TNCV_2754261 [Trichonephila clavipes]
MHRKDRISERRIYTLGAVNALAGIVRVQYFVRGGFVGHRSRLASLLSHLPVDGVRFLGDQKGVALQLQDARVGVGSNKDADRC